MEVHRQRCQACGSIDVRNLLVREDGRPQTVYVRCGACESLVARYVLSDYYHHGKGLESWLRSHGGEFAESGRRISDELAEAERAAVAGMDRAVDWLRAAGKDV
ncbi:MAG TPA: hypothetical protein RMF84_12415 [Polyangiaceae bacterium LLY-WYZ-14_1]|nr:hypothetical protein [Polyangiaceae bacterium LLY-WYZ-14_1]